LEKEKKMEEHLEQLCNAPFSRKTTGAEELNVSAEEEKLAFYIATDGGAMGKAEKALEYSIRKNSSVPYTIEWMDTYRGREAWQGWNKKNWYTPFSHFRFAVPEANKFKGRAIYMDVDQIILKDPKELFELEIPEDKAWLAIAPSRTDVMVFDCAKFKDMVANSNWPCVEEMKENKDSEHMGTYIKKIKDYWHPLPSRWCCNDGGVMSNQGNKFQTKEYDPETTCLLHYTQMDWQPWKPYPEKFNYPPHPHARAESIWWQMYAGALEREI
jgi:lipopolysaccharide biosynthesis glycosyltransferase